MSTIIYSPVLGVRAQKLAELHGYDGLGEIDPSLVGPEQRYMLMERWPDSQARICGSTPMWVSFHTSREDALDAVSDHWDFMFLVDLYSGAMYDTHGHYTGTIVLDPDVVGGSFGDVIEASL